jgi:hypothetical protein
MRIVMEAIDELLDVLVHEGVVGDLVRPHGRLILARDLAIQEQVGDVQEGRLPGRFLDGITAIAQDCAVAVDVGDGAAAARGVQKRRIVGQDPEVVVGHLDLAKVDRADGAIDNRDLIAAAGLRVSDLKHSARCHGGTLLTAPASSSDRRRAPGPFHVTVSLGDDRR